MEKITTVCGLTVTNPANHYLYTDVKSYLEDMRDAIELVNKQKGKIESVYLHYAGIEDSDDLLTACIKDGKLNIGIYNTEKKILQSVQHNHPPIDKRCCVLLADRMERAIVKPLYPDEVSPDIHNAWEERLREIELEKEKQVEEPEIKKQVVEPNPLVFAPWDERMALVKEATVKKNAERKEHHISHDEYER